MKDLIKEIEMLEKTISPEAYTKLVGRFFDTIFIVKKANQSQLNQV